jgi:hypothetical protein
MTIIYGLRWEFEPPPDAQANQQLLTVTGFPNVSTLQVAPPGTPLYETNYRNFAPRVGAAYQLLQHPGQETVLRGGFGIYYDLGIGNIAAAAGSFPHSRNKSIGSVPYPLSPENAAPPPPASLKPPHSGVKLNVVVPNHALPRSYHWNLTIDQNLTPNQVLSASYVGEAGRRLLQQNILFDPSPYFVSNSQINLTTNASRSDYHALQAQFQRRFARSFSALLSYSWAHSTDDVSTEQAGDYVPDPSVDHGSSDFDVHHAFSAAFTYEIPSWKARPVVDAILKDWSIDGIYMAKTAPPVNVIFQRGDSGVTESVLFARPDLVRGVPLYLENSTFPGGSRINPAAFSVPIEARQGTLRRNALRGHSFSQLDFAVRRQFSITERMKLHLRADLFNILNHPNFVAVDPELGFYEPPLIESDTFGLAGPPTGGPRLIQLSLRLQF